MIKVWRSVFHPASSLYAQLTAGSVLLSLKAISIAVQETLAIHMVCHTGTVLNQQQGVRCHSKQDQHTAAQQGGPAISRLDPGLQQQWDHAANAHLGNINIKPQSNRKVGWIGDQCPDGHLHSWSAKVHNRTDGNGCPQCSGHKVCKHSCLATKAPSVAAQWDYEANDDSPDSVLAQSNQPAWWHCDACGNRWCARIDARVSKRKSGCPQCAQKAKSNKKIKHPTIAEDPVLLAQWDHNRNAHQGLFPDQIRLKSNRKIFWLCSKCPAKHEHSWFAQPCNRTIRGKQGCPYCAGSAACECNSLQALFPGIAAEWDHGKNKTQPSDYFSSSAYLAWWSSPEAWQLAADHKFTRHVCQTQGCHIKAWSTEAAFC